MEIYDKRWISEGYESKSHEASRKKSGVELLKKFYKNQYSGDEKPIALEKRFTYKIDDILITGAIDRIDETGEDDGMKIVDLIDYKTGKSKKADKVKNDFQLALYSIIAEEYLGFKVRNACLIFVETGEVIGAELTDKLKESIKTKIVREVGEIRKGQFPAKPGMLCKYCDYRTICEDAAL